MTKPLKVCMFPATNPKNEVLDTLVAGIRAKGSIEIFAYHYFFSFFRSFDVLHIHWPDAVLFPAPVWRIYVKSVLFLGILVSSHALGRRIVWTVHNTESHEKRHPLLEKLIWSVFLRRVDHVVHLCRQSEAVLRENPLLTGASHVLIPHPHYLGTYPNPPERAVARDQLGLQRSTCIFLFFGMIRPYKGVEELIEVFSAAALSETQLLIAGEPIAFPQERLARAEAHPYIRVLKGYLARDRLEALIRASDVVVLPYLKILNSGVAITALSLGRPILAPRKGAIIDLAEMLGERWIMVFDDHLKVEHLVAAKENLVASAAGSDPLGLDRPNLSALAPEAIGARMIKVYFDGKRRRKRR